jgi:hypothetical protein
LGSFSSRWLKNQGEPYIVTIENVALSPALFRNSSGLDTVKNNSWLNICFLKEYKSKTCVGQCFMEWNRRVQKEKNVWGLG